MHTEQLKILIEKYLDESITAEEKSRLAVLLEDEQNAEQFQALILTQMQSREFELDPDETIGRAIREQVLHQIHEPYNADSNVTAPVRQMQPARRWRWIAASVVLLGAAAYLWTFNNKRAATPEVLAISDVPAGREGAELTLADGSKLILDTMNNGVIARQNGSEILLSNGSMTYQPQEANEATVSYNTMTTPRGRQFQFTLPDGTKVWLNAASSIRYPTAFTGKHREVTITGEAFFEVENNARKPFIVNVGRDASIEVLGTAFNVNAYTNEFNIKTSLVNGLVKVQNISQNIPASVNTEILLKPGQQAIVAPTSRLDKAGINNKFKAIELVEDANIDKITAWKKGIFNFEGSSLVEVMKELERWYDIEVVYDGNPPAMKFFGKMGKDLTLKDLLEVLDKSKVKFVIEGRKLIVKQ